MKNTINTIILALTITAFPLSNAFAGFTLLSGNSEPPPPENKAVRPLTAPFFHEDAFVTTDLRAWYLHHELGEVNGELDVLALQVRVALTENIQLLAYKDGYSIFDGTDDAQLNNEGWNDLGLGIKYALYQDWGSQTHIAVGAGYEFGFGDYDILQDTDELRFWVSANKGFDKLHLGATANYIIANGTSDGLLGNSDMFTLHLHADYYVCKWISPVLELNGYFVQQGNTLPFSGVDVGSINGGEKEDTITYALGFELRPLDQLGLRVAYETQLNNSEISLFGQRWSFSGVYEF